MNTQYTYPQKPTLVSVIAWTTLACGIVNIFWGLAASGMALATIVGICCMPLTILPSVLGIFEILYAVKLLGNPPQPVQPAKTIAVLEILCVLTGNVFAMVVGILSLVFYSDPIVKDYFARLNGNLPPEPIAPVPPIPPVVPTSPVPVEEEPIPSPITGEAHIPPAAPSDAEEIPLREPEPPVTTMDQTIISLPEEPTAEPEEPVSPVSPMDETIISSFPRERPAEEPPAPELPQEPEDPERPQE